MDKYETFIRIPVQFKDGAWATQSGRRVTAVNGTVAELVLSQAEVSRLCPPRVFSPRECVQFLRKGSKIRIALRVRQPDQLKGSILKNLIPPQAMINQVEWRKVQGWQSSEAHFLEIELGAPTENQKEKFPNFTGGLLVGIRGTHIDDVTPSTFYLPEGLSDREPRTLNHAYTILSEIYEIHRASHTGSIYQTTFYQSDDKRWYPLGVLKDFEIARAMGTSEPTEGHASKFWASATRWKDK